MNAKGCFNGLESKIRKSFLKSIETVAQYIEFDDVDFVIQDSKYVIEETGMAGYSPSEDKVFISIDTENRNLYKQFDIEFLATIGHELHHCLRHGSVGYGSTLDEALVSEGLACHFETELRNGEIPIYATGLDNDKCVRWLEKMRSEFGRQDYNHNAWFLGSSEVGIPRFTGYIVGFNVVEKYISLTNTPASKLYSVPSRELLS